MKKVKSVTGILLLMAVLFTLAVWAGITPPVSVSVGAESAPVAYYDYDPYSYEITQFRVEMDVSANRTIDVKETITAFLTGSSSHGIIRDFPLDSGVRYSDIKATCDSDDFSPYIQNDDSAFLSLYLRGDERVQGQSRTYTITYTMQVPVLSEEGYLPLDVIGYGWQTEISNVTAIVTVPQGLAQFKVYSGDYGTERNDYAEYVREGNMITVTAESLPRNRYSDGNRVACGITLDLSFEAGVLGSKIDASLWYALGLGCLLFVAALAVKMLFCRQPLMTTTVNLSAPEEMDPLKMGKLIDNSVDGEDLGALVFWLADQGYLFIDMGEDKNDPLLVKTDKDISSDLPAHIQLFYEGLFPAGRQSVRVSSLSNKFYKTAEAVKLSVNANVTARYKFYEKRSQVLSLVLGVLTVFLLGGFAWLYAANAIGNGYNYWLIFVLSLMAYVCPLIGGHLAIERQYKWKKVVNIFCCFGGLALGCLFAAVPLLAPCAAFGAGTGAVLVVCAALTGLVGGLCLCRSKEYVRDLGQILGFKQFILFTERDKITFMLKENPELYYHILPYAQVLGVTDAWTNKFKGLNMNPPAYAYGGNDMVFDILMWNMLFRSMNVNMARTFVSRPSSSGGGFNRGGFGGGFGGGGFGGGGGRGC